jgi:diaminopimelate decarboxylase
VAYEKGMLVNVNTLAELKRFPSDATCILGIRINPQVHAGSPEMFDVSKNESKFGVPISQQSDLIQAALNYPVNALHIHSGSQMQNLDAQKEALIGLREVAIAINTQSPGKINTLDIGGGLPFRALTGSDEDVYIWRYGARSVSRHLIQISDRIWSMGTCAGWIRY